MRVFDPTFLVYPFQSIFLDLRIAQNGPVAYKMSHK